ncbi:bifunctional diaminohydroxyphosphoribosylaminopyrimidine deaminase/5-amino-6-(5-phosphoribosylamino)uracil reductase RibD [Neorhodopirellula pilleata]|nr:bifunctional diaminohydroxyphosphoribosylaminopyrimidine deaminase/5-amino-6-(5-phosphoribosylamino)uracil reductase RibD [Neorhodopirellula pilleata]
MTHPNAPDPDELWMNEALELAALGQGYVEPNPMVGCVLVRDGCMIGRGYHQIYGGAHAEVNALEDCSSSGEVPQGSTAYVTLEPCCHFGKTPPCADALIRARVARVVVAVTDPFPAVDGGGIKRLRESGIEVITGVGADKSERLLAPYLKRVRTGRPWVIAKWAMSMDGRIATSTGESQWITGNESRYEVHQLRGRVDAIAVGMGTVIADDPLLTARHGGPRTPIRIVFARHRVPDLKSQLVRTGSETPTWIVAGPAIADSDLALLADHDVETMRCDSENSVDMVDEVLQRLAREDNLSGRPISNLMIEGGGGLLGSFAAAHQIDEAHVYLGAKLIGGLKSLGPFGDPGFPRLADATRFEIQSVQTFGPDVRAIYRRIKD